jgi:uncharacterized protein
MPVTPTYPGVYVEEVPSGVRTITGVATSITVFVGWTKKGPVDKAGRILSWQDFERQYEGLDARSYLGYAVNQFYNNGGSEAYIMRLVADDAETAKVDTPDGVLRFNAKNPGAWGSEYGIRLLHRTDDPSRFRTAVDRLDENGEIISTEEEHENLSMVETDRRQVESVINTGSSIIDVEVLIQQAAPPDEVVSSLPLTGGDDGTVLMPGDPAFHAKLGAVATSDGLMDRIDLFNLMCVPGETDSTTLQNLQKFCRERRAIMIIDSPENATFSSLQNGPDSALTGNDAINAAFYFPWIMAPDPLQENRSRSFPPSGFVGGIYARTDASRGLWKAPAGIDASFTGISGLVQSLTDKENGILNKQAINCIRTFPVYGTVAWGARTLQGNDERGSEWKYVSVRRVALFIQESLYRGTKWVVFEPNDEPLWAQIRLNIGAFMHDLFLKGAFAGQSPKDAYFVKCDGETTTQTDINRGIVNILVGFAPLKPAEFVIIKIQQIAGQQQS